MSDDRHQIIVLISTAVDSGARQSKACDIVGISAKTYQCWSRPGHHNDGRLDTKNSPANKLGELERQRLIKLSNEPEYSNLPPNQIVPKLADQGVYLGSESTFYRVLKAENQ